jgi:hypothetical protein
VSPDIAVLALQPVYIADCVFVFVAIADRASILLLFVVYERGAVLLVRLAVVLPSALGRFSALVHYFDALEVEVYYIQVAKEASLGSPLCRLLPSQE